MRRMIASVLIVLLAFDIAMAVARIQTLPGFFSQPGAAGYLRNLCILCAVYAVIVGWFGWNDRRRTLPLPGLVLAFGAITGTAEIIGVIVENRLAGLNWLPLVLTLAVFVAWSAAAFLTTRRTRSFRAGLFAAICSAGVCMMLGVTGGEAFELAIAPQSPQVVSTWAEFQRSGWTNPAFFAVANTLDSAATHLMLAPLIALIMGLIGAGFARLLVRSRSTPVRSVPGS